MTILNVNTENSKSVPRIALIIDSENWAFHNCAKQICRHLSDTYNFQIFASANYDNLASLMLDVQDFDLIHFFWRADLFRLLDDWTKQFFLDKGWDYDNFVLNVIGKANITTSIYDHLFLSDEEIREREVLFNALSIGYTAVSQRLGNLYASFDNYPKPYGVIEDGVDLDFFKPINLERLADEEREIVVGWVGNSKWGGDGIDHKGLETIIKPAVESLREEGYNVRGFYADRHERWLPHSAMNDYYNSIDIYVCASDNEGNPDPALESMACGIPIISTDVGIIPQLFGAQQKQYILPARGVEELKVKLKELVKNPGKRVALSEENLERIKNWSWEYQSLKWNEFFQAMLTTSQQGERKEQRDHLRRKVLENFLSLNLKRNFESLQAALAESENRIAEKDKRAEELQAALAESENRIAEKDKWAEELQAALAESENRIAEKDKWAEELQAALVRANNQAKVAEKDLNQKQTEVQRIEADLKDAKEVLQNTLSIIEEMESSKFWKAKKIVSKLNIR